MPSIAPSSPTSRYARNASIVLIGMRGGKSSQYCPAQLSMFSLTISHLTVGKRSLASVTAKALGWQALFTDQIFVDLAKQDILSYVNAYGWDDFRVKEAQIITWLLSRYPTNTVIVCGGGVVEREENRRLLRAFSQSKGPVIYILREKENVLSFLENTASPYRDYDRGTAAERWDVREQHYRECCSHEFVSLSVPMSKLSDINAQFASSTVPELTSLALKPVESAFLRLLRFILGTDTNHIPTGPSSPRTFSLSLTFPDLHEAIPLIDEINVGIDCWEIRLDWLKSVDHSFIAFQVALLRRHSDLPIRFTVRTRSQGGGFPDPDPDNVERQKQVHDLVMLAYRLGCEYVDLELSWPEHMLTSLLASRGNTRVIGSWHDILGKITWTGRETRDIYDKGARLGVDIIEMISTAKMSEDNIILRAFVEQLCDWRIPLIALNTGPEVSSFERKCEHKILIGLSVGKTIAHYEPHSNASFSSVTTIGFGDFVRRGAIRTLLNWLACTEIILLIWLPYHTLLVPCSSSYCLCRAHPSSQFYTGPRGSWRCGLSKNWRIRQSTRLWWCNSGNPITNCRHEPVPTGLTSCSCHWSCQHACFDLHAMHILASSLFSPQYPS